MEEGSANIVMSRYELIAEKYLSKAQSISMV